MSFWDLNDSKEKISNDGKFETGGGDIEPMPSGTQVLAVADEAKWDDYEGDEYISMRWSVLKPEEYKNRKVFQKIRVMDRDSKKADKAKRMLAAIDANAGGKLLASGERPTDESMTKCLVNKPMILKLQLWEIKESRNGDPLPESEWKRGNWVSAVSPRTGGTKKPAEPAKKKEEPKPEPVTVEDDFDDDIPF